MVRIFRWVNGEQHEFVLNDVEIMAAVEDYVHSMIIEEIDCECSSYVPQEEMEKAADACLNYLDVPYSILDGCRDYIRECIEELNEKYREDEEDGK